MGRMRARPKVDEARDILANVVVCHVPVVHYNFQQKVQLASIRMLMTSLRPGVDRPSVCAVLWRWGRCAVPN